MWDIVNYYSQILANHLLGSCNSDICLMGQIAAIVFANKNIHMYSTSNYLIYLFIIINDLKIQYAEVKIKSIVSSFGNVCLDLSKHPGLGSSDTEFHCTGSIYP